MLQYDDIRYSITFARCHLLNTESELPERTYIPDGAHEDPGPDDIDHEDDIDCDDDGHGDDEIDQLPEEAVYADMLYTVKTTEAMQTSVIRVPKRISTTVDLTQVLLALKAQSAKASKAQSCIKCTS